MGRKKNNANVVPPLGTWLTQKGLPQRVVADLLKVNASTVMRWCSGENRPSIHFALLIHKMSGGAIAFEDWLDLPECEALENMTEISENGKRGRRKHKKGSEASCRPNVAINRRTDIPDQT